VESFTSSTLGSSGDLARFVWLAWARLSATPKASGDVFVHGVELPGEALECYRKRREDHRPEWVLELGE
jgi:hypothetical protein